MFIFDIDGVLADNDHRVHHLNEEPRNWKAYFDGMLDDPPIWPMITIAGYCYWNGNEVVLLTGREETHRAQTEAWLEEYDVPYDRLIMRPKGSREDDDTLKVKLLKRNFDPEQLTNIQTIFEDRKRIVDAFRAEGWHVCHVAEGDF